MSRKNNSYSAKLKYRAVEDYLRGKGSLRELCQKYGIRSTRQLRNWIKLYNGHKELKCCTGGSRMTKGRDITYEDQLLKVNPENEKIRLPTAAPDKQHSNAGIRAARATERTAKQAQPALAKSG